MIQVRFYPDVPKQPSIKDDCQIQSTHSRIHFVPKEIVSPVRLRNNSKKVTLRSHRAAGIAGLIKSQLSIREYGKFLASQKGTDGQ